MGMLGNKSVRVVGVSATRLIEDDKIPNVPLVGAMKAVHQDESILEAIHRGTFSRSVWNEVISSLKYKTDRYFNASTHHGVTTQYQIANDSLGQSEAQTQIAADTGNTPGDITVHYSWNGPCNNLHRADAHLAANFGYTAGNTLPDLEAVLLARHTASKPPEVSHYEISEVYLSDIVPTTYVEPLDETQGSGEEPDPGEPDAPLETPLGIPDVLGVHPTDRSFPYTRERTDESYNVEEATGVSFYEFWYGYTVTTHYEPVPNPDYEPPTIPNPDYSGDPGQDNDPEGDPEFIANPAYDPNEPEEITPDPTTEDIQEQYYDETEPDPVEKYRLYLADIDEGLEYQHLRYSLPDGSHGYWLYEIQSNVYPAITDAIENPTGTAQDYTVLPMCQNRNEWEDLTGAAYEDVNGFNYRKHLFRRLDQDYQGLLDEIAADKEGWKTWSAQIFFGVPVSTKTQLGARYLWAFFNWFKNAAVVGSGTQRRMIVTQSDGMKYDIMFEDVITETFIGTLSDLGERQEWVLDPETNANTLETWGEGPMVDPKIGDVWVSGYSFDLSVILGGLAKAITIPGIKLAKQVTANSYQVITLSDVTFDYYVGPNRARTGHPNNRVLIPILREMLEDNFTPLEANSILCEAYHYVVTIRTTVRKKWYTRGLFQAVMIVIMIVLTVISFGTLAPATSAAFAALAAVVGAAAAAIIIAIAYVAIALLVQIASDWVADELGGAWATLIGIVVSLIPGQGWTGFVSAQFGAGLVASGTAWFHTEAAKWNAKTQSFIEDAQERFDMLEALWEEISSDLDQEMWEILQLIPEFVPGETPEQYFNRSLATTDTLQLPDTEIGLHSDVHLRLPTLKDSINQIVDQMAD